MKQDLSQLWTLFLSRFKVTVLVTVFILVGGTAAYKSLPRETEPTIEIPAATISTFWPGASPTDVEKLITNKIEKEIKGIENIKEYNSVSLSGISVVSVEFDVESEMTENVQNLREKLDEVVPDLPKTIPDDPVLKRISISDVPVLSLTLSGDFSWSELKQFSDRIEDELEGVGQVKDILVKGVPEEEVHILVDPIALQAKNIGLSEVIQTIRASHRDMPLGQVSTTGQQVEITVRSELERVSEFLVLPLAAADGSVIQLGEIATVRREFEAFDVETYFHNAESQQPAVLIDVIKSASKGNVILIVDEILGRIDTLKQQNVIPKSLNVALTYNRAEEIQKSLDILLNSGSQTLVLIAILMLIALGWRESVLAAMAIPLALLIAIVVLATMGRTFNGVSLFALVISIGLLVDNAIIIVEGISSGIHDRKQTPYQAAIQTLATFRWPIITGTLTTIFAFLPMLFFISGVSGQYISVVPITITIVLLGALFVSLFLLPAIGAHFYEWIPPKAFLARPILVKAQCWYNEKMREIFASGKKMALTMLATFGLFAFSLWLVGTSRVPTEVFPEDDHTFFTAKVELPLGVQLADTRALVEPISEALRPFLVSQGNGDLLLSNFVFTVGKASDVIRHRGEVSAGNEENVLGIAFRLTDESERKMRSYEIMPMLERRLKEVLPPQAEVRFSGLEAGPPSGSPIEVRVMGNDLRHLNLLAEQLKLDLENMPHTLNVRDSRAEKTLQFTWRFDRDVLAAFKLTPAQVLESLRAAVNGVTVVSLSEGDEEIDVDLRLDWDGAGKWEDPNSLDVLKQIPLKVAQGFVTFDQVAAAQMSSKMAKIDHRDGLRLISVRADLETGVAASQLAGELNDAIFELEKYPGEIVEIGGENEEGRRLMKESVVAMLCGLVLILVVLVWQFNSFFQSFVTLAIIPLSLTGVFIGFWLSGMTITFPTMIGIVSLAGIIVNDAIVLIDRVNQHLEKGDSYVNSLLNSGKERMQPIFLTSITTVVGMLPLSFSSEVWGGLGLAIVYGMTLSTVLTLLLIPCFLFLGERVMGWVSSTYKKA